jgi:hypothetical protein
LPSVKHASKAADGDVVGSESLHAVVICDARDSMREGRPRVHPWQGSCELAYAAADAHTRKVDVKWMHVPPRKAGDLRVGDLAQRHPLLTISRVYFLACVIP